MSRATCTRPTPWEICSTSLVRRLRIACQVCRAWLAWPAAGLPRECRTMDRPMGPCVWAPTFVRPHRRSFTLAPHHVHGLVVARRTTPISFGLWLCWPRGSSAWESGDTDLPLSGKARPADAPRGAKDPRMRHTASTVLGSTSRPHAELCGLRRLQRSPAREVGG